AHSRKFLAASGTAIEEPPRAWLHRKRQRVTTRFILDAEIAAGTTPSGAVRWNAPATRAELREQMRQLVAERAIELGCIVFAQARIQRDEVAARIGASGGPEEARIPFHVNFAPELVGIERCEDFACFRFERWIASQDDESWRRWKNEIELSKRRHTP